MEYFHVEMNWFHAILIKGLIKMTVSAVASQSRRRDPVHEEGLQIEDQELASLGKNTECYSSNTTLQFFHHLFNHNQALCFVSSTTDSQYN